MLWSSAEFGFAEVSDAWASGSSIMPQKKNPDAAELLRAKAPRIAGHLVALHGVMHALPLTYNKDMQEDKEHLFDAVDTLELCLAAATGMIEGSRFDRERMAAAASDELLGRDRRRRPARAPRDAVPRGPRRSSPALVRARSTAAARCRELTPEELAEHTDLLDEEYYRVLAASAWLESKVSEGGTVSARVREQLERARAALRAARRRPRGARERCPPTSTIGPVLEVARELSAASSRTTGCGGVIVETEAYHEWEPACHAYVGLTPRTRTCSAPPGHAYVYRSYGIHALLNAVCEPEGVGAAVLIRALEPLEGIERCARGAASSARGELCSGPGQAHAGARHRARARTARRSTGPVPIRSARRRRGATSRSSPARASASRRPSSCHGASPPPATATCRGRGSDGRSLVP